MVSGASHREMMRPKIATPAKSQVALETPQALTMMGKTVTPRMAPMRLTEPAKPTPEARRRVFEIFDSYDQRDARGNLCDFDLVIGGSCGCREAHPRSTLAAWNTPEPHTLDSAAGVERLA